MTKNYFMSYIYNLKATLDEIDFRTVEKVIKILLTAREKNKQIFIIGNGGSASTASHFACDLAKGTVDTEKIGFNRFRALSLTDNMAFLSAVGNDIHYDQIFSEQLKNYLKPGDVVIGISASGNSPNIIQAFRYAKSIGARTIGLLGFTGGKSKDIVDVHLTVSSRNYGIAEDFHLIIQHIVTQIIRRAIKNEEHKVIFLDRDGVINRKAPEKQYIRSWKEFDFIPGVMNTLRYFNEMGYKLVVLTNQQGVGKGIVSENALNEIHANMQQVLSNNGIHIEKIFYCPHLADSACGCRKPNPGLFYKAQNELDFNIPLHDSFFIGDSETDVEAGNRAGCKTILVGDSQILTNGFVPTHQVKNIGEAVAILRRLENKDRLKDRIKEQVAAKRKQRGRQVRSLSSVG
ncbi:MAG: HAD-IIIA family hydrolase [bacterium]